MDWLIAFRQLYFTINLEEIFYFYNKKCCIYAACDVSQTPIKEENRKGRNHRNLSYEEKEEILNKYEKSAKKGQIIKIYEIKEEYEKKCGHKIGAGTIYRVLKRHNWRKVMPRSKHTKKADDKEIEKSKKT